MKSHSWILSGEEHRHNNGSVLSSRKQEQRLNCKYLCFNASFVKITHLRPVNANHPST